MARTVRCTEATRVGRLAKAQQFWSAAQTIETFADDETSITDAYTTLAVHAGIAAADVICCVRLGQHARGDDHDEAVALLSQTDPARAKDLATLLRMKTRSGYGHEPTSRADRQRAQRAAARLVQAANDL
ncbi:MAG TPA: hypothetical protein VG795_13120 [Acidimicrobiia bacterium]|nr:hypothetical protein [Acidimicrobiia bacterium]